MGMMFVAATGKCSESNKEWIPGSELQTVQPYGTDSVAALAAYKIVLFELRRDNAVSVF